MKKRICSILLAVCLVITMLPITALSLGENGADSTVQYTVLAGSGGFSGEGHANLFDGNTSTKWCVKSSGTLYVVFSTDSPVFVSGYDMTTANDNASNRGRNPKTWTLYGCNDYAADGGPSWVQIHSVANDNTLQDVNYTKFSFVFEKETTAYQYYKLEITATKGADVLQMSEFSLTFCDHAWGEEVSADATCDVDGYVKKTCSVCNNTATVVYPKTGHAWVETARTPATCTGCGIITQKCSVCDATQSMNDPDAPALGHTWVETGRTSATCTESGKINQKCSVCDATQSINDPDEPALGHNYSAETGICDRCGDDLRYTFNIIEGKVTVKSDENNPGMIKVTYGSGQIIDNIDPNTVLTVTGSTITNELHILTDIPVKIKAQNLTIDRSDKSYAYAMLVAGTEGRGEVTLILEGTNTFKAGLEKSGICVGEGRTLIIEGDGSLNAVGGIYGAGIGADRSQNCGTVIINSGTVTATGKNGGAGIGGGSFYNSSTGGGGSVIINGGTVTANGNSKGSDIGGGQKNTNGICILLGGTVTATNGKIGVDSGIKVNEDGNLEVYGDLILPADITIPEGKTLVIPSGTTLTVPDGVTLTNNGTIINNNKFTNNGTFVNNGTFINNGTIVDNNHTPEDDDGDCATPVYCIFCGEIAIPAMSHDFSGEWHSDNTHHWHECLNEGCNQNDGAVDHTPASDDGDCTTPIMCSFCGEIAIPAMSHDFSGEWKHDGTYHWHECQNAGCNQTDEKVAIAPDRIEATISNAEYLLDTTVKPEDITVTAYYSDGFSEPITSFTTDIDDIDMSTVGSKTITVSLTKNGGTCTDDIIIHVIEEKHNYVNGVCSGCGSYEPPELKDGVYQIKNYANLYWFSALVNGTLTDGTAQNTSANAVLVNDITVNSIANTGNYLVWTPIGSPTNKYIGTFDGQGHKITGLYFDDASAEYVGLFGVSNGTIKNVGVIGSYFNGKECVGGVCGRNYGTIVNCYNTSTVNGVSSVGGIVGSNFGGEIRNCYNTGAISVSNYGAGGIAGYNYYATIMNCYSSAAISAPADVGGICGASDHGTANNCYHNSKYFKGDSVGKSYSGTEENVSAKTATQFTSGEVAYLLSNGVTDGTQAWYQTLGTDGYPTLDNTHGTVYCNASYPGCVGAPGTPAYTYENIARDTEIPPHNFVDGICSICGAEQHIVIIEADMHAEGLVLGANTVSYCKAELNTAEMYVVIKNINGVTLADSDLVGTGATITYYDRTTNAEVKTVTVVLYGDVNGDGLVGTADKDTVMLKAVGAAEIENAWFSMAADVNRDGVVDAFDAALINLQIANRYPIVQKLA